MKYRQPVVESAGRNLVYYVPFLPNYERFKQRLGLTPESYLITFESKPGQPLRRNPARVLDDKAIHIDDPQSPVWSGARLHRAKPVVPGRQKFALRFVRRAIAFEGDAVRLEHETMHEVVDRLTKEGIAVVICPQQFVAINPQPAR